MLKNNYYESFKENNSHLDYLKYGLTNEYGYELGNKEKECYDEEKITKTICKHNKE